MVFSLSDIVVMIILVSDLSSVLKRDVEENDFVDLDGNKSQDPVVIPSLLMCEP